MSETATHVGSGKVRELYALDDDRLLLVASDRISTFDVVLPTEIPDKGRVLTGLSAFWVARTNDLVPNHLLALRADGRSTECRRLEMLPIECVVRGYLAGSGWKDYQRTGEVCGHALPGGLVESQQLPSPIFTPATKAVEGHDENITSQQAAALIGEERFAEVEAARERRIGRDDLAERPLLLPGAHRGLLDEPVRVVARQARLDEREQHALAEVETVAGVDVAQHPLRPDDEALDEPREAVEHVVDGEECVRNDDTLGR